jgi:gluconokinase
VIVVLFGVAGVGKSRIGRSLAQELGWEFYDADNFHPVANIKKMKQGIALSDEDRQPWLEKLRQLIEHCLTEQKNAVFACSALKKAYRDRLRVTDDAVILCRRRYSIVSLPTWRNRNRKSTRLSSTLQVSLARWQV